MPPATIGAVLSFIPTNIWSMIKKFVKAEGVITFDTPFKISTKYTPALFVIIMCLSFANQFFRNIEIDCTSSTDSASGGSSGRAGGGESELNNYCWNYETFLVAKALQPNMRGKVTYPGIWSYVKGDDELVKQKYYKYLWFGLAKIAVVAFFPLFLWKMKGIGVKIKSLTEVGQYPTEEDRDATRAAYFIETAGFNQGVAVFYLFCKILALLSPLFNWMYLIGFIGKQYRFYGVDVLKFTLDGGDPWPNPMDALFPKIAKCEWAKYGYTGDLEVKAAQCQLPMNNFTQWSFFFLWWWLAFVLLFNFFHFVYFLFFVIPSCRRCVYRKYVAKVCHDNIEIARPYTVITLNGKETKKQSIKKMVTLKISYGDWLILYFLEKNLVDYEFRSFIRKLSVTSNSVLQINPPTQSYNDGLPGAPPLSIVQSDSPPQTPNHQIGFMQSLLKDIPPKYTSCDDSDSTLSTADSMNMANIPTNMGFTFDPNLSAGSQGLLISPPVKINRHNNFAANPHGKDSRQGNGKQSIRAKPKYDAHAQQPYPNHRSGKTGQNNYGMGEDENWD